MNASSKDSEEAADGLVKKGKKNAKAKTGKSAAQGPKFELYNLASDIGEKNDLAVQEKERVMAMRAKLDELLKDAAPEGQIGKEAAAPSKKKKRQTK
jgi:hypothetical protein